MKTLRKSLALLLSLAMLVCILAGCGGNGGTSSATSATSSTQQAGNVIGFGGSTIGSKFALQAPSTEFYYGNTVNISWSGLRDGETVTLKLEKKNGNSYSTVFEKTGLTGTEYKTNDKMENNGKYRVSIKAVGKDGTTREAANATGAGLEFTVLNLAKNPTVNAGMDFTINGKISEKAMNNYLARAITYTYTDNNKVDATRAILNVGAKYVCRALADWFPSANHEAKFPEYKAWIEQVHSYDPEIVFEACIFETCGPEMNNIKIPDWVFKAFGKKVEDRCFNYKKMEFPDGHGKSMWNDTHSAPDITREETQMFIYYRACIYIDIGIEALHLGQTALIGRNDPNREKWTKVVHLIRDYAKKNARRNYVIIDCHYPGQNFVGTDGVMLADFNMWPLRPKPVKKAGDSASPQKCVLDTKADTPYKKAISGKSPSGWTTKNYPFLLEFDNYQPVPGSDHDIYGYDEISWIVDQPDSYRRSFYTEVRKMVSDIDKSGHVALPGSRTTASSKKYTWYLMNNSATCKGGFSDEDAIIAAFKAYK